MTGCAATPPYKTPSSVSAHPCPVRSTENACVTDTSRSMDVSARSPHTCSIGRKSTTGADSRSNNRDVPTAIDATTASALSRMTPAPRHRRDHSSGAPPDDARLQQVDESVRHHVGVHAQVTTTAQVLEHLVR